MEYRIAVAQQLNSLLRSIRKERRMTQQQLGERLGLSQRTVSQFEARPEKASFERVLQALSALEIDLVIKERETTASYTSQNDTPKAIEGDKW